MTKTQHNSSPNLVSLLRSVCIATAIFVAGCGGATETPDAAGDADVPATAAAEEIAPAEDKTPAADAKSEAAALADEPAATDLTTNAQPVADAAADGSEKLLLMLTVFMLAVFLGVEIITKIPPTLHTPLMSGSNAISGITLIGAVLATGSGQGAFASFLGFFAVVFATVNCVGGFLVTHRMLDMFRKKK